MPKQRTYKNSAPPEGRGKIMCTICDTPLRDHKLEPCPELGLELGERMISRRPYRENKPKGHRR